MSGAPLKVRSQSHSMLVLGTGVTLGVVEFLGAVLWALAGAGIYGSPDRCQMIAVSFVPEDPGHLRRRLD